MEITARGGRALPEVESPDISPDISPDSQSGVDQLRQGQILQTRWTVCAYICVHICIYIYTHPKCIMCSTASSLILSFAAGWLGNDNNGRCRATPSQAKNHEAQRKTHKNINKQAKWKVLRMLAQPRSTCNNGVGFSITQAENEYRSCQTMLQMQIPSSCPGPSQGCQKKDCLSLAEKLRFYIITCVLGWLFLETRVVLEIPSQITLVRKARLV